MAALPEPWRYISLELGVLSACLVSAVIRIFPNALGPWIPTFLNIINACESHL